VQDVVADLQVLEVLPHRKRRGSGPPSRGVAGDEQQQPRDRPETAVDRDHLLDVVAVAFAEVGAHAIADRVELGGEPFQLRIREPAQRALDLGGDSGHQVPPRWLKVRSRSAPRGR
jgi:hypothetical protein